MRKGAKMGSCMSSNNSSSVRPIENNFYSAIGVLRDVVIDIIGIEVDLREVASKALQEVNCSADLEPVLQEFRCSLIDFTYVLWELEFVVREMITYASDFQHEFNLLCNICDGLEIMVNNFIDLLKKLWQKHSNEPNSPVSKLIDSTLSELRYLLGSD
ncbi:unnamed protein product [Orchesella dallaii]|uniref:Uncharacterized protein n=1 Tax=Orchesella dallaii TaxID=48710 RepID=A0ABP1S736_9HEXA